MLNRQLLMTIAATAWLTLWCCGAPGQEEAPRKRIAVLNFDNPDVGADAPSGLFGADGGDVGKGVSAMLIEKLVQGGKYTLVDRSALAKAVKEQSEAESDRADAYGLAAKVGRLLGLDAMIVGGVTQYGVDNHHTSVKAGGGPFSAGVRMRKSKAYVGITAQVLDMSTASVISSFTAVGESTREGAITIFSGKGKQTASAEILSSEFVESLLPEATSSAVEQIARQLEAYVEKIPALQIAMEGRVADVAGNVLTLNLGEKAGLKTGQQVEVLREAPALPQSSGAADAPGPLEKIGLATITEVGDDYATATFLGHGDVQAGDRVRPVRNENGGPH